MKTFESARHLTNLLNAYFASVDIAANFAPGKQPKTVRTKSIIAPENIAPQKTKRTPKTKNLKPHTDNLQPTTHNSQPNKPDPPTLSGLALYLGFDSIAEFDIYEANGPYKTHLKRARLLITAAYEKKLHNSYTSGPIFALKALGWNADKPDDKKTSKATATLKVHIVASDHQPVSAENDVLL